MGSGKSSVGRILSSLTGFALVDTDTLVAQEAGQSIPAIFKQHGEEYFRALETKVLQSLVGRIGLIVATGGGVVTIAENRRLLPQIGSSSGSTRAPTTFTSASNTASARCYRPRIRAKPSRNSTVRVSRSMAKWRLFASTPAISPTARPPKRSWPPFARRTTATNSALQLKTAGVGCIFPDPHHCLVV